jgi:hypothetical protein
MRFEQAPLYRITFSLVHAKKGKLMAHIRLLAWFERWICLCNKLFG